MKSISLTITVKEPAKESHKYVLPRNNISTNQDLVITAACSERLKVNVTYVTESLITRRKNGQYGDSGRSRGQTLVKA